MTTTLAWRGQPTHLVEEHRPDPLDPGHDGRRSGERCLVEVHVDDDRATPMCRLTRPGRVFEQRGQVCRMGEPAERHGAELVPRRLRREVRHQIGADGKDVGHPVDRGVDPGRVAGLDPGDDVPKAMLIAPAETHRTAAALGLEPLAVPRPVGLDHLRLGDLQHPPGCLAPDGVRHRRIDDADLKPVIDSITTMVALFESSGRPRSKQPANSATQVSCTPVRALESVDHADGAAGPRRDVPVARAGTAAKKVDRE